MPKIDDLINKARIEQHCQGVSVIIPDPVYVGLTTTEGHNPIIESLFLSTAAFSRPLDRRETRDGTARFGLVGYGSDRRSLRVNWTPVTARINNLSREEQRRKIQAQIDSLTAELKAL